LKNHKNIMGCINMKKGVITVLLIVSMFLIGCLDYKSYEPSEDTSLIDEIAQIEQDLGFTDKAGTPNDKGGDSMAEDIQDLENEIVQEITSPGLDQELMNEELQVISVNEGELVRLAVQITDPDEDTITHTFTPPLNKDGEWQTNYGDAGEYVVTITAHDGQLSSTKDLKIAVARVNVPPVIAPLHDITVPEGEIVEFTPQVTDPNGDELTVTVSGPLVSGTFPTDHTSSGEYNIQVIASDGELESRADFLLTVEDVNKLPVLTNIGDITVLEGELVKITPLVSDLDDDPITVTIGEPVGDDGIWQTTYTDHGEYFIQVTANDGKDTVSQRIKVVVKDVNKAPQIVEVILKTG
jgi:hypothetical protein